MVFRVVLSEEIYALAESTREHFGTFLVRFFVPLPVCFLDEGSFAAGAKVLVSLAAHSGLFAGGDAGFEVVF